MMREFFRNTVIEIIEVCEGNKNYFKLSIYSFLCRLIFRKLSFHFRLTFFSLLNLLSLPVIIWGDKIESYGCRFLLFKFSLLMRIDRKTGTEELDNFNSLILLHVLGYPFQLREAGLFKRISTCIKNNNIKLKTWSWLFFSRIYFSTFI